MFDRIPAELKSLQKWVMWRYEETERGQTKIPYMPHGKKASVTDPSSWVPFDVALAAMTTGQFSGIGFVLSRDDPYSIIDLDNKPTNPATPEQLARHQKIYETFNSYTELSVSGTGVHIVVRGAIPSGVHRDNVEVYSELRFMAFTGNVLRDLPIVDFQQWLLILHTEMHSTESAELIDREGTMDDRELVDMAMNAANADKFNQLCRGEWEGEWPSQSEADFALLSIIGFYTVDNEQVRRIFRMTALGKREKATRDDKYLNRALAKIRAKQPEPLDFSQLIENANKLLNTSEISSNDSNSIPLQPGIPVSAPAPVVTKSSIPLPPGLVGDLAQYFYSTAVRPVPEIALAAAIALTAGVCARTYNVSGTGLNQYIITLARTGSGKEGAQAGIENMIAAVRPRLPMIDMFMGPAAFASGQSLIKVLDEKPCFVSVLGEFGLTLQQISDARANGAEKMLRKVLLDLYAKSGWNRMLQPSVYSDITKNTSVIHAPNVTILGESTPETFFDGLDASHIAEGLIPRFSVIEYTGPRPVRNRNANQPPNTDLAQRFMDLATVSITASNSGVCCPVQLDDHSSAMLDDFDTRADAFMNQAKGDVELQVWNRAHLKALKLSALLAVGINPYSPVVTVDLAQWAIDFVLRDCELMTKRFQDGDVGQGDSKQYHDLMRIIQAFFKTEPQALDKYGVPAQLVAASIVPYAYLMKRTANLASYRQDKLGATAALKKVIGNMVESGALIQIGKPDLMKKYGFDGAAYAVGRNWR